MKIKDGLELMEVCGEQVIVAYGLENIDFSKLINLNETAAYCFSIAKTTDFTIESLSKELCNSYEISYEEALKDVKEMIEEWQKIGIIQA